MPLLNPPIRPSPTWVLPVRFTKEMYATVQTIAAARNLPISTLLRQWITQGATTETHHLDVAAELERLASIIRAEHV